MRLIGNGRYQARLATGGADLAAAQHLRQCTFRTADAGAGVTGGAVLLDADRHDDLCRHVLVEDAASGDLVCCYRVMSFASGAALGPSYAAQVYDLTLLQSYPAPMAEIGRFCTDPAWPDPDILRVAWAALTRIVDAEGVGMLFGCSSFRGTDPRPYARALALLAERHLAPGHWMPRIKAPDVVRFAQLTPGRADPVAAMAQVPPLLRTYLAMGGWVSDHAVIDRDLDTLHVFTGLAINAIPAARARLLRAIAG